MASLSCGLASALLQALGGCGTSYPPVDQAEMKKSEKYKELHPEEFPTVVRKKGQRAPR